MSSIFNVAWLSDDVELKIYFNKHINNIDVKSSFIFRGVQHN